VSNVIPVSICARATHSFPTQGVSASGGAPMPSGHGEWVDGTFFIHPINVRLLMRMHNAKEQHPMHSSARTSQENPVHRISDELVGLDPLDLPSNAMYKDEDGQEQIGQIPENVARLISKNFGEDALLRIQHTQIDRLRNTPFSTTHKSVRNLKRDMVRVVGYRAISSLTAVRRPFLM
jgi:hypothetical protein